MRIGLFGFTFGHENMGCQALTCSFLNLLNKYIDQDDIQIISFHEEKDLGEIPSLFPRFEFSKYNISLKKKHKEVYDIIKSCDYIFDETYGDGFSDIYFSKSVYRNTLIKIATSYISSNYILTPQTYGPFKDKVLERLAGIVIKNAKSVYSRDELSTQYAMKLSKRNIITVTDLAFSLPFNCSLSETNKKRFGINVSGLLWNGGFNGANNQFGLSADYHKYICRLIEYGISNKFEVHLIPHVTISSDPHRIIQDSDIPACRELYIKYPECVLAPEFTTPYAAKNYIASMDVFIGARMHATIAAFSSGVLTIPLAYSRKFKGLFDSLNYSYILDATEESTEEMLEHTISLLSNEIGLKNAQNKALEKVKDDLELFEKDIYNLLHVD